MKNPRFFIGILPWRSVWLAALALVLAGVLAQQIALPNPEGPRVEVVASQINAKVRVPGCTRDVDGKVVCAISFESQAQTNQTVTVLHASVRGITADGFSYPGYLTVEGGTTDAQKTAFALPARGRAQGRLVFPQVPPEKESFAVVFVGGVEFRGLPIARSGSSGQSVQAQAPATPQAAPQAVQPTNPMEAWDKRISIGSRHVLYVADDGTVWAWGSNAEGQLGIGKKSEVELKPVKVQGLTDVVAVAAGWFHSLALRRDGTVWAWGKSDRGQIGLSPNPLVPHPVRGLTDVVDIRAGDDTSYALRRDGTVWAWGSGELGLMGNGEFKDQPIPIQVQGLSGIKAFPRGVIGIEVAGVLKEDGTVWVWGHGGSGLLGNGYNGFGCYHWTDPVWRKIDVPTQVPNLKDVVQLAVGGRHFVALLKSGEVVAWGLTAHGQAGMFHNKCAPITPVRNLKGVVAVSAGRINSSALTEDGTLWAWGAQLSVDGEQNWGMLGIGPNNRNWEVPVPPVGMDGVVFWKHWDTFIAIKKDGTVWAWGRNDFGQVGDGTREHRLTPVQIKLPGRR